MKKNGILHRISTAVLAGAMLLSLASCGASSSQTASSAAGKVTGTGSAKGIEGDVVVEVTADADTIYSIVVTEQNETQGIGSVACEQLPDAMVAANSYNVDGIAGATVTSDALKEAVKAALENAGLDASAFAVAKAADTTVEKTAETLDCDVVVVGAGGAGLTAAAQAAENGAKVIVVEKMPIVGGNSLKATGGMNAADTQYQADLGITDSGVQEFIEDTINGGHGINDRSLVTVMAEQSSDAIDWLTRRHLITDELEELTEIQGTDFTIMSPISYFGRQRRGQLSGGKAERSGRKAGRADPAEHQGHRDPDQRRRCLRHQGREHRARLHHQRQERDHCRRRLWCQL